MHDIENEKMEEVARGWWLPKYLIELYEKDQISLQELCLLGKIGALCDPKRGCWASNKWLAKWWKKSPRWTIKTISKFHEMGLIKVDFFKTKRRIHIKWEGLQ
jgi:predicted glycosyl hydrolase (DUF1957 family)